MRYCFAAAAAAAALAGAVSAQDAAPAPALATQAWSIPPLTQVVDSATLTDPQLLRGQLVFRRMCTHCHGEGRGMVGTSALGIKYGAADPAVPALLEERTDLTPELVTFFVRNGVGLMAQYRKTEVTDAELADLAAYLSRPRP